MWVCVIKYLLVSDEWCISKYYLQYLHINDTRYSYIRSDNPEAEADCSWRPGLGRTRTWAAFVRRPGTMSTMSHRGIPPPQSRPHAGWVCIQNLDLTWLNFVQVIGGDQINLSENNINECLIFDAKRRYLQYNIVNYETTYSILGFPGVSQLWHGVTIVTRCVTIVTYLL